MLPATTKLVFISNIPAPYQVKFSDALSRYFDTQFWFYDKIRGRDSWWELPMGDHCRIIPDVLFREKARYYTRTHITWLKEFNPDIVMLGGFSIPANYAAYRWAKKNGKKTVVLTEMSRTATGELRGLSWEWKILRRLYKDVDAVFTINEESFHQFKEIIGFGARVKQARYAADLEPYFHHPVRTPKASYTILFANRLTEIYNPLAAIRIFHKARQQYVNLHMKMNAAGELRTACEALIKELKLENHISFLESIPAWDDMHLVYQSSDILLLPATFSAGNFTICEAMASGMGIVISDKVLGNGRDVVNGVNGFNLPLDEDLFAGKLLEYVHQPALFVQHAAYNRPLVQPLSMQGTAQLFATLLSGL